MIYWENIYPWNIELIKSANQKKDIISRMGIKICYWPIRNICYRLGQSALDGIIGTAPRNKFP